MGPYGNVVHGRLRTTSFHQNRRLKNVPHYPSNDCPLFVSISARTGGHGLTSLRQCLVASTLRHFHPTYIAIPAHQDRPTERLVGYASGRRYPDSRRRECSPTNSEGLHVFWMWPLLPKISKVEWFLWMKVLIPTYAMEVGSHFAAAQVGWGGALSQSKHGWWNLAFQPWHRHPSR
jgi:hypothetical protein